jgi:type I restriction-modification system DNA methylase subunit
MTQKELEKYLWGAATLLRGTIDAGDYKQYIFPLLFFKRICDVYDEEFENALAESDGDMEYAAFAEHHHFQVPEACPLEPRARNHHQRGHGLAGSHARHRKSQPRYPLRYFWRCQLDQQRPPQLTKPSPTS